MLTYKNQLKELILPEYGRHIQNMVDHCLTIDDRAERTRCARSIVDAMSILLPPQGDRDTYRRKLWDHLMILSDFSLDVDLPFKLERPAALDETPTPVPTGIHNIRRRHYGHNIELTIETASAMDEGPERDALISLLANHMKKTLLTVNPDGVDDEKIFSDLYEMSQGRIRINPGDMQLHQFQIIAPPKSKKKRKH